MSLPNIPNITPTIGIDKEQCVSLLIASVALEELGLSHIVNAEAEKIQYVLGTLEGQRLPTPASVDEVLKIDKSVCDTLRGVIKNQMLLGMKMEDIISYYFKDVFLNIATVTAEYDDTKVTSSDKAYYHTKGGNRSGRHWWNRFW